jgi:hypothetical protein
MPPDDIDRDMALLIGMLNAARECTTYVASVDLKTVEKDRMRIRAVERTLEIVGEARVVYPTDFVSDFHKHRGVRSSGRDTSSRTLRTRWKRPGYRMSLAIAYHR